MTDLNTAVDRYKQAAQEGRIPPKPPEPKTWAEALDKHGATPDGLVGKLTEVLDRALYGYQTEKVTSKGEILAITETDLKAAIQALKELARIRTLADTAQHSSGPLEFNLIISEARPGKGHPAYEEPEPSGSLEPATEDTYDFT